MKGGWPPAEAAPKRRGRPPAGGWPPEEQAAPKRMGRPPKGGGRSKSLPPDSMYLDATLDSDRSRSGRKIKHHVFHDEVEGGGLKYKHGGLNKFKSDGMGADYVSERRSAVAAKSAISRRGRSVEPRKDGRRKPGARECMIISRKFDDGVIEQKYFDVLLDYTTRGKVDHLVRIRERMDEHSRYLEAQLAGLEALVKEKGELNIKVPPGRPPNPEKQSAR